MTIEIQDVLQQKLKLIDVRAPIEFAEGHIPGSLNFPLLNNQERAQVGTCYKQNGREAAIALGHQIVSGEIKKARLDQWCQFISQNPQAVLTCFRGGLRSQTVQRWLAEAGYQQPRLNGGTKKARQFFLDLLKRDLKLIVITGMTGSGKTQVLRHLNTPKLDLEKCAEHRGSAFGLVGKTQPSQVLFENRLALEIFKYEGQLQEMTFVIEDESRMIGSCVVPEKLFMQLRGSAVCVLEENIEKRIDNIYHEYIIEPQEQGQTYEAVKLKLKNSVLQIVKKLGGLRTQKVLQELETGAHRDWIRTLLLEYYDPFYQKSFQKRNPHVLMRGSHLEVIEFLQYINSAESNLTF